jgi:hypothetical protein
MELEGWKVRGMEGWKVGSPPRQRRLSKFLSGAGGRPVPSAPRQAIEALSGRTKLVSIVGSSRILEKQNSLQMSQVFSFARIGGQMGLAFQGFYKRDRRTDKLSGFPRQIEHAHTNQKPNAACCLRSIARTFNP